MVSDAQIDQFALELAQSLLNIERANRWSREVSFRIALATVDQIVSRSDEQSDLIEEIRHLAHELERALLLDEFGANCVSRTLQ